ncbi:sigma-70 family RNA polymerase sigma factor [Streptomyces althioticus]|uniref:sigma-70 family RNA polymerase sigma factor n=1 Tax=Streptomyces althioticus TaxID=83380 RepID=UPI0036A93EE9
MNTSLVETRFLPAQQAGAVAPDMTELDDAASLFTRTRPSLLHIAHRIVGSPADAEDIVQEAWLRLQRTDREAVQHPSALLRTITARLAMNVVQSARKRREFSASPWLPDPADSCVTPEEVAERHDAVEHAVALLLATLTPNQRAAYLLREGFGYSYDRIAALLRLSVVNARQQVVRAQRRLDNQSRRRRQEVDSVAHHRLVQAFLGAARTGDLALLEHVLLEDAS